MSFLLFKWLVLIFILTRCGLLVCVSLCERSRKHTRRIQFCRFPCTDWQSGRRCSLSLKCCAARAKYLQCLRGLPIHFFGDSLARNQHQSMQCILDSSPRNRERVNEAGAPGDWHRDQGQTELCVVIPEADLSIQWLATNFLEFQLLRTVSKREPSRRPSAGGQSRWTDAVSPTG